MSTSHRIVNAVPSSSRPMRRVLPRRFGFARCQQNHSAAASTRTAIPPDLNASPSLGKGKRREDIRYDLGGASLSSERLAFSQELEGSEREELGADWMTSDGEAVSEGIEPGRVVEARR